MVHLIPPRVDDILTTVFMVIVEAPSSTYLFAKNAPFHKNPMYMKQFTNVL